MRGTILALKDMRAEVKNKWHRECLELQMDLRRQTFFMVVTTLKSGLVLYWTSGNLSWYLNSLLSGRTLDMWLTCTRKLEDQGGGNIVSPLWWVAKACWLFMWRTVMQLDLKRAR